MDTAKRRLDPARLNALLQSTAEGDTDAFAALYEETKAAVFGFCLSILRNRADAEDLTHDCFVRVFLAAEQYRRAQNPMAWVLTIARNLCLHRLRDRARPTEETVWADEEAGTLSAEDRLVLRCCMDELSDEERSIAVLHAVSGLKFREIASLLGIPLSTVLSKYRRSMKKLRDLWQEGETEG